MKMSGVLLAAVLMAGAAWAEGTSGTFRVTADRVNLRSRPLQDAEVVGQVDAGTLVTVRFTEGDWAEVAVPTNVGAWVSAAFVTNGVVQADRLRVRSGPGATFRDIGAFCRGDRLVIMEMVGDWIRCRAPADAAVWIATTHLAPSLPPESPAPATESSEAMAPPAGAEPASADESGPGSVVMPAGLTREELAAVLGQGAMVERQGLVEQVPIAFLHCSPYRLVTADSRRATICYLRGNDEQLPSLVGRRLWVRGREFWLRAETHPLLYPQEIKPLTDEPAP